MNILTLVIVFPVLIAVISLVFFIVVTKAREQSLKDSFASYIKALFKPILFCFATVFIYLIVSTIVRNSPQGPLAILFYTPLTIAVGMLIGTIFWAIKK